MSTPSAVATFVFAFFMVLMIGAVIRRVLGGWRRRAERQAELVGKLPPMPDLLGPATVAPTRGRYLGSTLNGPERIAVGDLSYRAKAVLTRYPEGILVERSGAGPIWIPQHAIAAIRIVRALAGTLIPAAGRTRSDSGAGILAIRWRLPSGAEIDSGFRGDDRRDHDRWTQEAA